MATNAAAGVQDDMEQLNLKVSYTVKDSDAYDYHIKDVEAFRDEMFGEIERIVQNYVDSGELSADEYGFEPWNAEIEAVKQVDGGKDLEKTVHSVEDFLTLGERGWGWLDYRFERGTENDTIDVAIRHSSHIPRKRAPRGSPLVTVRDRDKEPTYSVNMRVNTPHPSEISVSNPLHELVEELQERTVDIRGGSFRLTETADHTHHENAEGIY